jgi:ABC-type arginine transport system permease subunit
MIFYYLIIAATIYLLFCSYMNYIMEKREIELKNKILFTSFKYKK